MIRSILHGIRDIASWPRNAKILLGLSGALWLAFVYNPVPTAIVFAVVAGLGWAVAEWWDR